MVLPKRLMTKPQIKKGNYVKFAMANQLPKRSRFDQTRTIYQNDIISKPKKREVHRLTLRRCLANHVRLTNPHAVVLVLMESLAHL
jgi:hypothetical protein